MKVRLIELMNNNYRCWIDAESSYLYGRSALLESSHNSDIIDQQTRIEQWLDQSSATYTKHSVLGCLPEWTIKFKDPKDVTMFRVTMVN